MYVLCVLAALLEMAPIMVLANDTIVEDNVSRPAIGMVEATIRTHAIIGFSWIDQPLNKIVLIKTGQDLCVIRYLSFFRVPDQRQHGYEDFYGEAELYSKSRRTVRGLHLTEFPLRGFHSFAFDGGKPYFQCGHERIFWSYPTGTALLSASKVSLASTQLEDFSKIDFQDPNLQWFKYEEGRKMVIR